MEGSGRNMCAVDLGQKSHRIKNNRLVGIPELKFKGQIWKKIGSTKKHLIIIEDNLQSYNYFYRKL